jgi:serine/threonine protein kinase
MELPPGDRRRFIGMHVPVGDPVRAELCDMVDAGDDSLFLANAFRAGVLDLVGLVDDDLPSQIGKYKILRALGRGGMGVVYLALRNDDVFHKVVALKVIGDATDSPASSLVERFKQERQILAGLDHPNIARILDGGNTDDGRPFYVMEYVAGSPIDEYCARMNTDVPARVRMMAQVCDAVDYLHNNAIAHRDIKPHNILVTVDGHVKLVDFGIAKVETVGGLLRSPSASAEPTMIMTPGYASPEQIAGDGSGKSGDIYSLAVVLYQLLTGRLPHTGQDGRLDVAARAAGKAPEPPSKDITKTPRPATSLSETRKVSYPDLDRVVLTALQRDPLQRYGTVQLFGEDLRRCLDGRPIVARPRSVTYIVRKTLARNAVAATVAAIALLTVGAGGWLALDARFERVELQAKEEELELFVDMLAKKVARWQEPEQAVPAAERVADVQAASRIMESETVRLLSARAPDPPRVKRAVGDLQRVLDQADTLSHDQPPLRKEIALAFRKIGDFESRAPLPQLADKDAAARSYRRAASIAANLRVAERPWADQQLTELSGLLDGLGSPLEAGVATGWTEVPVSAAPVPPPSATVTPRRVLSRAAQESGEVTPVATETIDVDPAALADVQQRLHSTTADAERARRNFETLRDTLAARGQTIRSDVATYLAEAERLIDEARSMVDANDLPTAEENLRQAAYQLRRVFQAVGS